MENMKKKTKKEKKEKKAAKNRACHYRHSLLAGYFGEGWG